MTSASRPPLKTYSHLLAGKRMPSRYEIATSRLLYYPERGGFEVALPLSSWYETRQRASPLFPGDWEAFADPRATTYTDYTRRRAEAESFLDSLLRSMEAGPRPDPDRAWLAFLESTLHPLRFAFHGLQMAAAYIGSMAPASRIVIVSAMQAGDEVRRIQRFAQRFAALREKHPEFGREARARWQDDPVFQPLRRAIEQLLVTWDWGEATVALNFCLKPRIDALLLRETAKLAAADREPLFAPFLQSLHEDCQWHREWAHALLLLAAQRGAGARSAIMGWCDVWEPPSRFAIASFAPAWESLGAGSDFEHSISAIEEERRLARAALAG
jgi:toluene monooxygenase system protein E